MNEHGIWIQSCTPKDDEDPNKLEAGCIRVIPSHHQKIAHYARHATY